MANRSGDFMKETERMIDLATQEAERWNDNSVGTEHLLLALIADEDTTAAKVLTESGLRLDRLRQAVEFMIGAREFVQGDWIGLTPRAKRAVELAQLEACMLNSSYCGSQHLLLGILREGEGLAVAILESFGDPRPYTKFRRMLRSKCPRCAGKVAKTMIDYPLVLKGRVVIVRNVPAEVCSQCGELVEIQFNSELEERIWHLVDSDSLPCGMAEVLVYELQDMR